jgi:glycosyltransferase involved in cell wall biosynthesis
MLIGFGHGMQQAPVSVIIPCYRCTETIGRAVVSIIQQTLPPKEVLLVEDCSGDEGQTLNLLYQLQQTYQGKVGLIRVIPLEKNRGPAGARNVGWNLAQQPLIAFLDADDAWDPKKIEIQYKWMESHPEVALTGHSSVWIRPGESAPNLPNQTQARPISRRQLLLSNRLLTRSVMLRSEITYRFEPAKRYAEDYLLWLKIVLGGHAAWRLELPLAYSYKAHFGGGGLSGDLWKMEKGELDAYKRVYQEGIISLTTFVGVVLVSLVKYFRRLLLSQLQ